MINPAQIRAARGLLDWSQDQLAKEAKLRKNGSKLINRIERGEVTAPHQRTLEKIVRALEAAGLEFLPNSGVRKKDTRVEIYEGPKSNERLLDDVYQTLLNTTGKRELCIAHLDEEVAIKHLGMPFIKAQICKRKKAGITHRLLVRADDPGLIRPLDTYHSMPDEYFSKHPLYIYGSKLAILAWDPTNSGVAKSVVIDDERFADCARKLFDFIWDSTTPV